MSIITKTIKPAGGGDYTNLQDWYDAIKSVYNAEGYEALCYAGDIGGLTSSDGSEPQSDITITAVDRHDGTNPLSNIGRSYLSSPFVFMGSMSGSITFDGLKFNSTFYENSDSACNFIFNDCMFLRGSQYINIAENADQSAKYQNCVFYVQSDATDVLRFTFMGQVIDNYKAFNIEVYNCSFSMKEVGGYGILINMDGNMADRTMARGFLKVINCAFHEPQESSLWLDGTGYNFQSIMDIEVRNSCFTDNGATNGLDTDWLGFTLVSENAANTYTATDNKNNLTIDSFWVNTDSDLTLKGGSPCLDAGQTLIGFSTDINGIARPQRVSWDVGAFELLSIPNDPAILDDYGSVALYYSNIRTKLDSAAIELYNAVNTVVLSTEFEPTIDLLRTFHDVYVSQRQTLLDNGPFLPAVRALNNSILFRGRDPNGDPWASLNDWMGYEGTTVPSNWITMSADAGFTISTLYCSNCP